MTNQLKTEAMIRSKLLELEDWKRVDQCLKEGKGSLQGKYRALIALADFMLNNVVMMRELMIIELQVEESEKGTYIFDDKNQTSS